MVCMSNFRDISLFFNVGSSLGSIAVNNGTNWMSLVYPCLLSHISYEMEGINSDLAQTQ
jgi:hypothetical protein